MIERSRHMGRAGVLLAIVFFVAACSNAGDADGGSITLGADGITVNGGGDESSGGSRASSDELADFTYDTPDGVAVEFADLSDGPVVINFFASWCTACVAEMPDFEVASRELEGEVTFLGLAMQDRPDSAARLVEQTGVTYPIGLDGDGSIFAGFGGIAMPTTIFVAADGTVAKVHTGVLDTEQLLTITDEEF